MGVSRPRPAASFDGSNKFKSILCSEIIPAVAGFFNRLGFSGLSLGTIASAFLVLVVGMIAVQLAVVAKEQFSTFADLAKLLFGAFIGSFATDRRGKVGAKTKGGI